VTTVNVRCPHCGKIAATVSVLIADDANDVNGECTSVTLSSPIDAYPWPVRIRNAFQNFARLTCDNGEVKYVDAPIKTFSDLCSLTRYDLLRTPNVGRTSMALIDRVLASNGLHFSEKEWS